MKELHNHIFSNTTCISKETMLRYINKQLVKNELYEVEKHMLDCELCSDAYEGMQFAQNSSILFAIDSQIDQRVAAGNSKAPIMKNLMVAASILIIVFGAYFTFDYFNTTIDKDLGIAVNKEVQFKQEDQPVEEELLKNMEANTQENSGIKRDGKLIEVVEDEEERVQNQKYRAQVEIPIVALAEESPEVNDDLISYDREEEIVEAEEKVVVAANITGKREDKAKGESGELLGPLDDANNETDNRRGDNFDRTIQSESTTSANSFGYVGNSEPEVDKKAETLKKSKNKTRNTPNKKRFKSVAQSPAYYENGNIEQAMDFRDNQQQKTITIDSYKVVDYTKEYQAAYDLKNAGKIETKSVSAGFETQEDKDVAEKEMDEITVEISYKETLEKAIKFYKSKEYRKALGEFDVILWKHPKEVNAQFYSGLCHYHLKQYGAAVKKFNTVIKNKQKEFNEEAYWYKALTLIEMKDIKTAKKLLNSIIKTNGFYKAKAEEELKKISN